MARVIALHIWIQNKKETWKEPEVVNRFGRVQLGKRIILDIEDGTPVAAMKTAVAEELDKYFGKLRYYYVVAVVQRDDGEYGYKTIVPKTIIKVKK